MTATKPDKARQFIPFCMVGGIGFLVDAGILSLLVHVFDYSPELARLASFPCAVTATWYLNRKVTFSHKASVNIRQEWSRYLLVSSIGNFINLSIYLLCLQISQTMHSYPELALAIASITAMLFNYKGASSFAFRADKNQ